MWAVIISYNSTLLLLSSFTCNILIPIKTAGKEIGVLDLKRIIVSVIINTNLIEPRAIAVDPRDTEKRLYFTDSHGIYRAGLDGVGRETIIETDLMEPNGLSIGMWLVGWLACRVLFSGKLHQRERERAGEGEVSLNLIQMMWSTFQMVEAVKECHMVVWHYHGSVALPWKSCITVQEMVLFCLRLVMFVGREVSWKVKVIHEKFQFLRGGEIEGVLGLPEHRCRIESSHRQFRVKVESYRIPRPWSLRSKILT